MEALDIAFLVAAVASAALLLGALRARYSSICRDFEEDEGWHRMWHERILDESNGHEPT